MQEGQKPEREEDLFAEATYWFFRLRAENVTVEDREAFEAWFNRDPLHQESWNQVLILSSMLQKTENTRLSRRVRRFFFRPAQTTRWLAAAAVIAVAAIYLTSDFVVHPDFQTGKGQRQAIVLADGTRVDLDGDTALKVQISEHERRISILKGEAYFEVAKDRRDFRVIAGENEIRDIGTEFDVSRGEVSTVSVKSGIVDVGFLDQPSSHLRLLSGQAVEIEEGHLSEIQKIDFDSAIGWRRGKITFSQMKLADVVARLNRYRFGRIVIINPSIREERVSGTFDVSKPDAALEALKSLLDIHSITLTSALTLLH